MTDNLFLIKQLISEQMPGVKVILFGSRARNEARPESDFDILVVSRKQYSFSEKMRWRSHLRKMLVQRNIPAEILLLSENEMELKKNFTGHIAKTISEEGINL